MLTAWVGLLLAIIEFVAVPKCAWGRELGTARLKG